jgi:CDP-glucose 4,6-dehydratase
VLNEHEVSDVFHLAAQTIVGTANRPPRGTWEANVRGTWNLLEACRTLGSVRRVVVASSDKAYGSHDELPYREDFPLRPRFPYDVSKAAADMIARSYASTYGMRVAVTRLANVYGPGDLNWSRIVPDTARAHGGRAWNAGWGRPVSVMEVVRTLISVSGVDVEPDVRGEGTPAGEISRQYLDSSAIRAELGWEPKWELERGLRAAWEWYKREARSFDVRPWRETPA